MVEFDKWVAEPYGYDYNPRIFEIQYDLKQSEGKTLREWLKEAYLAGYLEGQRSLR